MEDKKNSLKKDVEVLEAIFAEDIRRPFFRLQAISRIYIDLDEGVFTPLFNRFKRIEDAIGKVAHQTDLMKTAQKLDHSAELINHFAKKKMR